MSHNLYYHFVQIILSYLYIESSKIKIYLKYFEKNTLNRTIGIYKL